MPLLGALFANLFGGLVALFTLYFTRKVAFGLSAFAAMSTITAAVYVGFRGVLTALNSTVLDLPEIWTMVLGLAVPAVAPACLGAYFTVWGLCMVYRWQKDLLNLVVKV